MSVVVTAETPELPDDVAYAAIRAYCLARFPYPSDAWATPEHRESRIDYDVRSYMPNPDRDEEFRDEKDEGLYAVMRAVWAAAMRECGRRTMSPRRSMMGDVTIDDGHVVTDDEARDAVAQVRAEW